MALFRTAVIEMQDKLLLDLKEKGSLLLGGAQNYDFLNDVKTRINAWGAGGKVYWKKL